MRGERKTHAMTLDLRMLCGTNVKGALRTSIVTGPKDPLFKLVDCGHCRKAVRRGEAKRG